MTEVTYLCRASGWGPSQCGSSCCDTHSWWHHHWWCGCWWDMADTPHHPVQAWRNPTGMLEDRKTEVEWGKKSSLLFVSSRLPRSRHGKEIMGHGSEAEPFWEEARQIQHTLLLPPDTLRVLHFLWFAHGCHLFQGELRRRERRGKRRRRN